MPGSDFVKYTKWKCPSVRPFAALIYEATLPIAITFGSSEGTLELP